MRFLPVVERELRVASRRPRLYWGRFFAALAAIALVAWFWMTLGTYGSSAIRAKQIFGSLSTLAFAYALLAGLALTADSISEEKREGTLGLLFLTDLKGYDVVFGKLFASSLHAVYGLVGIFPVMAIPLLLGGLTAGDFWRMALVLMNTLLFSLSLGIFVSTMSKHDRKAQFTALLLMLLFTGGIPALVAWYDDYARIDVPLTYYAASPAFPFAHAFDQLYQVNKDAFWFSVSLVHGFSWVALISAAIVIRHTWQDRPATGRELGWRQRWQLLKRGTPSVRKKYRERLLGVNPVYWLSSRNRLKPIYVLGFLAVVGFFWLSLYLRDSNDMLEQSTFMVTALLLHLFLKVWMCSESGRLFAEDKRSGALELTLSTPITVREILEGQFLGLLRQFGGAAGIILIADVIMMVLGARLTLHGADSDWVVMAFAGILVLIMDLFTIPTLGMWLGLTSRRPSRAAVMTGFYILVLPWLILFGFITFVSLARFTGIDSLKFFIGAYFVISLLVDLIFFLWASGNLTSRFRQIVTERFDGRH